MGCHFLLQGIFPTQGTNPRLLHSQADSLPLSHQGSHVERRVGETLPFDVSHLMSEVCWHQSKQDEVEKPLAELGRPGFEFCFFLSAGQEKFFCFSKLQLPPLSDENDHNMIRMKCANMHDIPARGGYR